MRRLSVLALALAVFAGCATESEPTGPKTGGGGELRKPEPAWNLAAAIQRKTLGNGLTVLVREKHGSPVVTCQLAFKVGAVDERDGERGMAHFLEHMLFKGSTSYKKGEIDLTTMRHGGSNNAYTTRDMTAYHFSMPASSLDAALTILAEMLGQSTLDEKEFEFEKGPVLEEMHAGEDEPWTRLWDSSMARVYTKHPYHHPVIGYEPEIQAMKRDAMKAFYDKYYKPANAVLIIVGDVDAGETFRQVEEKFGAIPRGTPVPALEVAEPAQTKEIRTETEEDVEVDRLLLAWRGPKAGEPDDLVLDVISQMLGTGRMARLNQRLVEKDHLASSADVSNYSGRYPGTFVVNVEALPGADRAKIEAAIADETAKLAADGPTREELERARNGIVASFIFRAENSSSMADLIAQFACTMTVEDMGTYVERLGKVTADDVKAVATRLFRQESRTVCWSISGGEGKEGGGGGGKRTGRRGPEPGKAAAAGAVSMAATRRVVLPNGLVLMLLENHDLPIFSMQSFSQASAVFEPEAKAGLANLTGQVLEDGTAARSGDQIALQMEFVGGRLSTSATGVEATVLARDQDVALDVALDILMNSTFPEDKVAQKKDQILAGIAGKRDVPREQARAAFNELIYGKHPLHRPADGYEATVQALTRDDVVAHYRKYFVPNNTVIAIVGDFDAARVEARLRELTASWKTQALELPPVAEAVPMKQGVARGIPIPGSAQVNVYMGHLGIRRNDPDYYALLVLDNVLGTGSGFTDRMSRTIRDEMGLVYAVGANITGTAGTQPGTFRVFFATKPEKMQAALEVVRKEIARIRTEPVSAEELGSAQAYLAGSFVFETETDAQQADLLIQIERFRLGLDFLETYPRLIRAVTAADVLRVAAKHLDPAGLSMVVAGPVNEKGEVGK